MFAAAFAAMALPAMRAARAQSSDASPLYPPSAFSAASGETVYRAICQGCHMADGTGAIGAGEYPALAANPKLGAAPYVAMMVLDGHGAMPGFASMLDDRQVAEVVHYVGTHFGNDYPQRMSDAEVAAMRQ
ncbi:MAG: cytochrome c [Pseudoxanthomonas sp.]